ncbi:MAG: FtsW/RodA/SpoVE family cell cycle protein [Bacteroidales bacterium]|nr:FtsW/RodA/SpoVE family cell cycle protein [Bacteroidales bacterium]
MKRFGNIFRLRGDKAIWAICIILSCISLVFVYSSIGYMAIVKMHTTPTLAFAKHVVFVVMAYLVAAFVSNLNYQFFSRISGILYVVAVGLLFFTLLSGGRWMRLPLLGSFQPSEIAKIIVIITTAKILTINHDSDDPRKLYWWSIVPMSLVAAVILPENLSTALLVFGTGLVMMYLGGVKKSYLIGTVGLLVVVGVLGLFAAYQIFHSELAEYARHGILARAETWSNRVDHWLHHDETLATQENTALMAVADGGLFRINIGGTIHARLMTQANNDFIFAIIIEEVGSLVGFTIFLLYTILYYRCIMMAYRSGRRYGSLLIMGLSTSIYLQAIVHMCVCVGVIPVTGQTLPLISTGGTAYLLTGFSIGLIQSVINNAKTTPAPVATESNDTSTTTINTENQTEPPDQTTTT